MSTTTNTTKATTPRTTPKSTWGRIGLAGLALFGCSSTGLSPSSGTDAAVPLPPDLLGFSSLKFSIGPIDLVAGEERTVCTVFHLPTTMAIDVVKIDSVLRPGSHHLIIYKSNLTTEQLDPQMCKPLDIGFGPAQPKNIPVYISETQAQNALPLPAGVAYHFEPGQMMKLEAHYLNATSLPIKGQGEIELTVAPPAQKYIPADIMFCGSVLELYSPGVPPGLSQLSPGFFAPPAGAKVFGLTAHEHRRGSLMTIAKSSGVNQEGTMLVNGAPWDNEPFVTYDDQHLLSFMPGEGLRWQCSYNNTDPKGTPNVKFGESADSNEMCFFWAYYYPSAGHFISTECIR